MLLATCHAHSAPPVQTDTCHLLRYVRPSGARSRGLWDCELQSFLLPDGLELMLGETGSGSSTPSMVRKVLAWRAASTAAAAHWAALAAVFTRIPPPAPPHLRRRT